MNKYKSICIYEYNMNKWNLLLWKGLLSMHGFYCSSLQYQWEPSLLSLTLPSVTHFWLGAFLYCILIVVFEADKNNSNLISTVSTNHTGDRGSIPTQWDKMHKQVWPIPIRLDTSLPSRAISFEHSGSISCCRASGNALSLFTQCPHRVIIKVWSNLILPYLLH